ncbi:kinase-like domain-containing protein [Aspergillus lucknowensis]|uniref:Kinase-like domain-containing protein n=1 Tax=Aspergillus lucknowensis TaxID=176173 RepID=A0ABR4LBZ3_9EURO
MEATQESTQPCTDPRRAGRNNSGLREEDLEDIICILHPSSPAALEAVAATARVAPWHILQKNEVEYGGALDIALRLSSKVNDPSRGFCFGRTLGRSDILLAADPTSRRISNTHFRIYFTNQSILMLEDVSTNGTIVDDCRLRKREKDNSRMLIHGSVIQVINGEKSSDEVKFVVRMPSRDGHGDTYSRNLDNYIDHIQGHRPGAVQPAHRQPSTHGLQSWNTFGMHWSGSPTYNVTGQIGKGAFAVVYKLATKQHGAVFACKELDKRRFMKNGVLDQKIDNEMRIMRDLKHPNIVQFIEHKEYDRWFYIIMEYVPCGELSAYLATLGKIQEDMVQTISRQVLHALRYLHRRKITHRDIKPDNILIASQDPLKVKLSDFGLSKVVQEETFLKTFCGTLLYCAPEVYPEYEMYRRGDVRKRRRLGDPPPKTSPYDQSVDMWSLGAVLYHILAGVPPYTGRGDDRGSQMLRTIMTTEPDYNILRSAGVSEAGVDLVSKLLNRDPQLRPKEQDCLKHPWLVDVPDMDEYEDDDLISINSDGLSDIGEDAEEELDASQLSLEDDLDFEHQFVENDGDPAQSKRPRIGSLPAEIHYPSLPNLGISQDLQQSTPRRLFGEITSSALRSSHALGDGMDAFEDGNFSVHDFVSSTGESMISDGISLNSVLSLPENPVPGSAVSLLGAENLVQQLNMNSTWHPGTSNNPLLSAEAPSPQLSRANEAVDDYSQEQVQQDSSHVTPKATKFSRRIELPIPDTASERSSSDDSATRRISDPHGESTKAAGEIFDIELANTMDAKTGLSIPDGADLEGFEPPADPGQAGGPVCIPRPLHPTGEPLPLFGKLTTLPGSIIDLTIPLRSRMTSWGRGPQATICYPDPMDSRVPVYALEVTFWAPAIEARIAAGQDWMTVPGLMSILSTKTRGCIWVNDIELRKGPDGGGHYGKLYTGDIITVYRNRNRRSFLKFKCEFYLGDSVPERPENEKGFAVRKFLMSKDSAANQQPVRQNAAEKAC